MQHLASCAKIGTNKAAAACGIFLLLQQHLSSHRTRHARFVCHVANRDALTLASLKPSMQRQTCRERRPRTLNFRRASQ